MVYQEITFVVEVRLLFHLHTGKRPGKFTFLVCRATIQTWWGSHPLLWNTNSISEVNLFSCIENPALSGFRLYNNFSIQMESPLLQAIPPSPTSTTHPDTFWLSSKSEMHNFCPVRYGDCNSLQLLRQA